MILELLAGVAFGTGVLGALGYLYNKNKEDWDKKLTNKKYEKNYEEQQLSLHQRLRNALRDAERQEGRCRKKIESLYKKQLEILQKVGRPSYIFLKSKDLYFKCESFLEKDVQYYYQRDLRIDIDPEIIHRTKNLACNYKEHMDLYGSKLNFFKQLSEAYEENLQRLDGKTRKEVHLTDLQNHENELDKLDNIENEAKLEEASLRGQLFLEDIERELDFQEECFREYTKLDLKHTVKEGQKIDQYFEQKIRALTERIDNEDLWKKDP